MLFATAALPSSPIRRHATQQTQVERRALPTETDRAGGGGHSLALPYLRRAILQPSPAEGEWWGARLARFTLVLFWQLVALPPLVFCVYLPRGDVEREPEPSSSSGRALYPMEEVLLLPNEMAEGEGKPLVSTSTSSSSSPPSQLPSPSTPCSTPVHSPSALKNRQVEPLYPESDENKQSQMRSSTGSVLPGRAAAGNESLDTRRQSFTAMAADSRATMRRRSYDLSATPHHTASSPGGGSPVGVAGVSAALRTMGMTASSLPDNKGHLQHLRVYGRTNPTAGASVTASPTLAPSTGGANVATTRLAVAATTIRENHVEGEALVDVVSPATDSVWTRGRPVTIEWKVLDAAVPALAIELLEEGSAATTVIARDAPNTGSFTYHRVPWGMASGSKYFLKVSAATLAATRTTSVSMATAATVAAMVSSSARYMTTGFFTISSAP